MTNGDDRLIFLLEEMAENTRLSRRVDSAGRLIQNNDRRIAIKIARQRQPLPVPLPQSGALDPTAI